MSVHSVVTLAAGELTPRVAVTNGEFVLFGLRTSPGPSGTRRICVLINVDLSQPAASCVAGQILQFRIPLFEQAGTAGVIALSLPIQLFR